eukprot:CAMPEP_0201525070 /NCGR_PEP_ID=MMETSP0161_2-20130828/26628_1 /ASSEMBLY_ACC=CAM_ASM_000251 /TAXON_ID=180227 /ORGANISM="Neoparamoeba aestuarina, Strain SoJaBio B1-5/56/2" /LENGTH=390 /DNA_ID=CAMNT_0047924813 /DNA_START=254 /DNA_END=1426 /DNA_ORIENTATION=+
MNLHKRALSGQDLQRELARWGVKDFKMNPAHPIRSLVPMRILASLHNNQPLLAEMTNILYSVYWEQQGNPSENIFLKKLCAQLGIDMETALANGGKKLKENTTFASQRGVFGVPAMFLIEGDEVVGDRFYWGQDRTFLVARACGLPKTHRFGSPLRLHPNPSSSSPPASDQKLVKLNFFFDYGSPYAFLAATQVERIAETHNAKLVYKPILLGALFKMVGTPNVPMMATSEAKRAYGSKDLSDWLNWWGGEASFSFQFPSTFPIRTVQALRVTLIVQRDNPDLQRRVIEALFKATWLQDKNIGDENVLFGVLTEGAGVSENRAKMLISEAKTDVECKEKLKNNTQCLYELGGCGVPSFQIEEHNLIWGQDRLNVIEDWLVEEKAKKAPKL